MGNDRLSGKQVGSQASRRVTRRLAWIQSVCISINAVPALKGLMQCKSDAESFYRSFLYHFWTALRRYLSEGQFKCDAFNWRIWQSLLNPFSTIWRLWLAWDPTCLPLSLSFPIKNEQNFKVLKSRRQYNLFLENYPAFKGLMQSTVHSHFGRHSKYQRQ